MQRIGEEEQPVAGEPLGGEHGGDPPAHGAAADQQRSAAHALDLFPHAGFQHRHGIGPLRARLAIREVEAHDFDAKIGEKLRKGTHARIVAVAAGAVREHECRHSSSGLPLPPGCDFSQFLPSSAFTVIDSTVPSSRQRALTLTPSGCERGT